MAKSNETELMEFKLETIYTTLRSASEQMQQFRGEYAPHSQSLRGCQDAIEKAKTAVSNEMSEAGIIPF